MQISIAYALPHRQEVMELDVPEGTTAEQAVHMSGILEKYPEIDLKTNRLGIYAKLIKPDHVLREGDRVEIYRPLPRKTRDPHAVGEKKARLRSVREQTRKNS